MGNVMRSVLETPVLINVGNGFCRGLFGLAAIATVLALPGCATYSASVAQMEMSAANRDMDGAIKTLDDLKLSGPDETLHHLNKGTLLRLQ